MYRQACWHAGLDSIYFEAQRAEGTRVPEPLRGRGKENQDSRSNKFASQRIRKALIQKHTKNKIKE